VNAVSVAVNQTLLIVSSNSLLIEEFISVLFEENG